LGGVLIVTFRNSIANFRLFSPTDRTDQSEKPIDQFEKLFELFDFSVMGEGSRLHAGEPPALHIASDATA
jgi:hypothetical protein